MQTRKVNVGGDGARAVQIEATEALIARHVEPAEPGLGPGFARLRDSDLPVWLVVANIDARDDDLDEIADDFEIEPEAALAALYYYWRHRDLFDSLIAHYPTTLVA